MVWFWKLFGWQRRTKHYRTLWFRGKLQPFALDWVTAAKPDEYPNTMIVTWPDYADSIIVTRHPYPSEQ